MHIPTLIFYSGKLFNKFQCTVRQSMFGKRITRECGLSFTRSKTILFLVPGHVKGEDDVKERIQDMMFTTSPPAELRLTVKRMFVMCGKSACQKKPPRSAHMARKKKTNINCNILIQKACTLTDDRFKQHHTTH